MSDLKPASKVCPSLHVLTPPDRMIRRISRSSGKQTTSFRCTACVEKAKKLKNV